MRAAELMSRPRTAWPLAFTTAKRAAPLGQEGAGTVPSVDSLIAAAADAVLPHVASGQRVVADVLASVTVPFLMLLPVIDQRGIGGAAQRRRSATTATTMAGEGTRRRNSDLSFDAGVGYAP